MKEKLENKGRPQEKVPPKISGNETELKELPKPIDRRVFTKSLDCLLKGGSLEDVVRIVLEHARDATNSERAVFQPIKRDINGNAVPISIIHSGEFTPVQVLLLMHDYQR